MDAITSPRKEMEGGELGIVPSHVENVCRASNIDGGYSMCRLMRTCSNLMHRISGPTFFLYAVDTINPMLCSNAAMIAVE